MSFRHATVVALVTLAGLTGCGKETPTPGKLVDISGTVTVGGKPLKDTYVYFQPAARGAQPAYLKLGPDGSFSGQLVAGEYTWHLTVPDYVRGAEKQKAEAALKGLPGAYLSVSQDRKVDVDSGSKFDLQVK